MKIGIAVVVAAAIAAVALGIVLAADGGESAQPCAAGDSTPAPQPTAAQLEAAGLAELPLAPDDARVDLAAPAFSQPTKITNSLFPISDLRSAILNGRVEGKPFKTETTLLPDTQVMRLGDGRCVEVLVSQYVAYLDGRIEEVALDRYAQADDGSVWYLGEDVFNYDDGVVADLGGSWLAGIDGPAAMIMPADPQVGAVYRPENVAGLVFEEVTVREVGKTVAGPHGPVQGAITVRELHDDGSTEDKVFAPGYGEFFTGGGGEVEALALAVPTDALPGGVPPALATLSRGEVFAAAGSGRWAAAQRALSRMRSAWDTYRRSGDVPLRLGAPTARALDELARAVADRDRAAAQHAALDVEQAAHDLELQYRPAAEVDRGRFDTWLRRLVLDARAKDEGAVLGDVSTVEWIRDRIETSFDPVGLTSLDQHLKELRESAAGGDFEAASAAAAELRAAVS